MLHFAVFILMGLVPYIVLWFYVWFQSGICSLGAYVFCTVSYVNSAMLVLDFLGQAFIWERIFFARNVKAFSGYLRKPKNIAMYTIFNVNV